MRTHIHPLAPTNLKPTEWSSYLLSSSNPFRPYILPFLSYTSILKAYTAPLINALTQKPDLATLALLLVIIFLSLKILNMLLSTVMFWLRLAARILFWGSLAIVGLWMWTRGPEGILDDLGYWGRAWSEDGSNHLQFTVSIAHRDFASLDVRINHLSHA